MFIDDILNKLRKIVVRTPDQLYIPIIDYESCLRYICEAAKLLGSEVTRARQGQTTL